MEWNWNDRYKYFGVLEGTGTMPKEMIDILRIEYRRRVKKVAKSRLYAGSMVGVVNSWVDGRCRFLKISTINPTVDI